MKHLQDDLGHYDTGIYGGPTEAFTRNITQLARQGVVLDRSWTHWHCSPTRRSILTGRWPIHHGEQLSGVQTDDIDLRQTSIGEKLKSAGYTTAWYGKGHTGYQSMHQLPNGLGFDRHIGFLTGS